MESRTEPSESGDGPPRPRLQLPASCDPPPPSGPAKQLVWIIFGGTGHMGRSLVKCALARGDLVCSVGRVFESRPEDMEGIHENCLGLLCDVRSRESVNRVFQQVMDQFGRVDVVANCSGYGVIGSCEDQDEHDLRNQFETNFMGTLHIIHATLPYFRRQQAGRYLIFSSTSGALGVPGLGPYCATKYAVEGLIEAMLYETDAFHVKATLIEPGLVRRDEPDSGNNPLPTWGHFFIKPPSEHYSNATSPALHAKRMVQWLGDRQPTSAVKCAELVWQLGHCSYPPLRLLLGSYAIESIRDRMRSVTEELEDWKHLNFATVPDSDREGNDDMSTEATADSATMQRIAVAKQSLRPRVVFSGIQPTGVPHLGNYVGALKQWANLQREEPASTKLIYSIVDLHAITVPQSPETLRQRKREVLAALLAIGLDPERYEFPVDRPQSKLSLASSSTLEDGPVGSRLKLGLFSYPVLQAADILVHRPRATHVPVGHDQQQHLEFARECVTNFNHAYGNHLVQPSTIISPAQRIMSLTEPTSKMSKSHKAQRSRILITDTPEEIRSKIATALTDSVPGISYDPANRPGISNLLEILSVFDTEKRGPAQLAEVYAQSSPKALKDAVADTLIAGLNGVRDRYLEVSANDSYLDMVEREGARKAQESAKETMDIVKAAVGL
ncbi:3-oxoacyl-acyl-carrier- reductase [Trichoderma arundinaceum]|uniref:tryptophan--tRNA ligase n=1 Tax=Trichoderma arundinaceum TaxID=490622 RepID=A0A395NDW7_TRIAR|nr:3-oxoacyl-acyl-carrier- reductase [Trichoderma arundinaceum]